MEKFNKKPSLLILSNMNKDKLPFRKKAICNAKVQYLKKEMKF